MAWKPLSIEDNEENAEVETVDENGFNSGQESTDEDPFANLDSSEDNKAENAFSTLDDIVILS